MFRRAFRRPPPPDPDAVLRPVPDDLPRRGLFAEPVVVARLRARDPERLDGGQVRVEFRAEIRDADGKRCPDVAVEARVDGPERSSTGQGTTDLAGRIRFRMVGSPGAYRIEILDVAAGGLEWDRDASEVAAEVSVPG